MSKIRNKETKIEKNFRQLLLEKNIHYRKNVNSLFGKPDLANKKRRFAIFIDSCFWHGCNKHCRMPSSNKEYWKNKISKNKKRDREVSKYYKNNNWLIIRLWEHDINNKKRVNEIIKIIKKA